MQEKWFEFCAFKTNSVFEENYRFEKEGLVIGL